MQDSHDSVLLQLVSGLAHCGKVIQALGHSAAGKVEGLAFGSQDSPYRH